MSDEEEKTTSSAGKFIQLIKYLYAHLYRVSQKMIFRLDLVQQCNFMFNQLLITNDSLNIPLRVVCKISFRKQAYHVLVGEMNC